jgi:hypothetical protein
MTSSGSRSRILSPGLLIASADLDHVIPVRRLGTASLLALLSLAGLLGNDFMGRLNWPASLDGVGGLRLLFLLHGSAPHRL